MFLIIAQKSIEIHTILRITHPFHMIKNNHDINQIAYNIYPNTLPTRDFEFYAMLYTWVLLLHVTLCKIY